jgi:hypothetical protein
MEMNELTLIGRELAGFLPHLMAALSLLILGWLGAWIVRALVERGLRALRVDDRLGGWGFARFVGAAGPGGHVSFSHAVGTLIYFVLMLFVLMAFFDALQLTGFTQPISRLLEEVTGYVPRFLGAIAVLIFAWIVASVLRLVVYRGLQAVGLDPRIEAATDTHPEHHASETIASVIFWTVLLLFLPAVLRVLDLETAVTPLTSMFSRFLTAVPDIFAALVILLVGWIVARVIRAVVIGFTEAMGAQTLAERTGLTRLLGGQRVTVILGTLAYVVTLIPVILTAIDALHLEALSTPAVAALTTLFSALPYLFGSLLVLVLAFAFGRLLRDFVAGILRGFGFDGILATLGIAKPGAATGARSPSRIGGTVVMVFVMVFAAMEAAEILNLLNLAALISRFIEFLAQVVLAVVIAGIGFWLANATRRVIVADGGPDGGVEGAGSANLLLGNLARYAIIVFAFALGFQQMGLGREIVVVAFGLVLGAICLALALSFGLGSRDLAQRTVEEWARRLKSQK